ncbi:ABC transporter permease [Thermococcus sp. Bubb.Bath]|uniref:ABC transporter permease n=1 Tax=Thermococcus sp. Bubb.Bath TaxID=1638242 RepID=UPI00143B3861|nr:ABC transporter permease subunit [Thermococcus sp. Bubb.Bath]NJF25035.1 ABC transporter permease [Thermococcus sp. Bubb.Bath]
MLGRGKGRTAAILIVLAFVVFSIVGPYTVNQEKIKNWDNETYWSINPRGVPPDWYGWIMNLPPTEWLKGDFENGSYVFTYDFHYSASPQEILILSNSTSSLRVDIIGPDGRRYTVWNGPVYGIARPSRLPQTFSRIAKEKCGITVSEGDILFRNAYNIIFSKPNGDCYDHPDFLKGTYRITVSGNPPLTKRDGVRIRVIGRTYGNLGTDTLGRDVWAGFAWGARDTIATAILGAAILTMLGLFLGAGSAMSGWMGNLADFISKLVTVTPTLPAAVALVIIASRITPNYTMRISSLNMALILGILLMGNTSRNIRSIVEEELRKEYVESARALGGNSLWILRKHVSRVLLPYTAYQFSLAVPGMIAFMTLMGFFNVVPGLNWGALMSQTLRTYGKFTMAWWQVVPVGTAIGLIALGFVWLTKEIEYEFLRK